MTATSGSHPAPASSLGRGVLIYDADCGFCTTTANRARAFLPSAVSVAPWQSLDLGSLGLTIEDVSSAAYFVDASGQSFRGHHAVGRALELGPILVRPAGWLIRRPPISWLAAAVYAVVAKYRYKLPGSTEACKL